MALNFLSQLTGSFAMPAAENPIVAVMEAAYRHHGLDIRYINCEVPPERLADAVKGARAMGWIGFNCSIPHKVAVIEHLDGLGDAFGATARDSGCQTISQTNSRRATPSRICDRESYAPQ
jgi:shikimate dehydrogenase